MLVLRKMELVPTWKLFCTGRGGSTSCACWAARWTRPRSCRRRRRSRRRRRQTARSSRWPRAAQAARARLRRLNPHCRQRCRWGRHWRRWNESCRELQIAIKSYRGQISGPGVKPLDLIQRNFASVAWTWSDLNLESYASYKIRSTTRTFVGKVIQDWSILTSRALYYIGALSLLWKSILFSKH